MYDIVGKRNLWFTISAILTIPGLIFIFLGGLRPSIDFTGGTGSGTVAWNRSTAGLVAGTYVDTITVSASEPAP